MCSFKLETHLTSGGVNDAHTCKSGGERDGAPVPIPPQSELFARSYRHD